VLKGTYNRCVKIDQKISIRLGKNVREPQGGFLTHTVERVFWVGGMLTAGRRNRMTKSLEMNACPKINRKVLAVTGFYTV